MKTNKKWRTCLSGKAENCYKKLFGYEGDRICSACKAIVKIVEDVSFHPDNYGRITE